jgi:hypothetical protein
LGSTNKLTVSSSRRSEGATEPAENFVGILSGQILSSHQHRMPRPGIAVQSIHITNCPGPQRIEVDIPDQFQKIRFFLAYDGFVTVLKEMPNPAMPQVKGYSIPGQQPPHERRQLLPPGPQQKMRVVSHQRPRQTFGAGLPQQKIHPMEKGDPIGIIVKNWLFLDAPYHDVL